MSSIFNTPDHNELVGLVTGDPHTQYAFLAGRSGGQVLKGGTANTDHLDLYANSATFDQAATGKIRAFQTIDLLPSGYTQSKGASNVVVIKCSPTITIASGFVPDIVIGYQFGTTFDGYDTAFTALNLVTTFQAAPVYAPGGNLTDAGFLVGFDAVPSYRPKTGVTATCGLLYGFMSRPYVTRAGTGVANATTVAAYTTWPTILFDTNFSSTGTLATVAHFLCGNPSVSGGTTITEQVGLDIPSWTNGTTKISFRSLGTTATMRHAGAAKFGATGAPVTTVDVQGDLAVRGTDLTLANGANNNVALGSTTFRRITGPTAAFQTSGFSGTASGKLLVLQNSTTQVWTIQNNNAGSTAANQIVTLTGGDIVLTANNSIAVFIYDPTGARWVLIALRDGTGVAY